MAGEIKISIGGTASGLVRAADESALALSNLQKAAQDTAPAINSLAPAVDKASASLDRMKNGLRAPTETFVKAAPSIKQATEAIKNIPNGANQAANALTNLGRVAQDAPFGFIGIQNNLNPLLESFQRLKTETGTSSAALKALGSSLMGAAGIGLALSVVSSLVTVAIQKYGSLGNALNALFSSTSATEQATKDLGNAFTEAAGKAAGETAMINALVSTARNEELSKNARLEAINKLNKEYDEFLPKLTLENINTKEVSDSVDKLTASLLRNAKIRGVQDLIAEETKRQAESYRELLDVIENGESGFNKFINILKSPQLLGSGISNTTSEVFKLTDAFSKSENRIQLFNDVLKNLIGDEATAGTLFTENAKKGADALKLQISALERLKKAMDDVGLDSTEVTEKLINLKIRLTTRDAAKNGLSKEEVDLQIRALQKELSDAFRNQAIRFESIKVRPQSLQLVEITPEKIQSAIARATGFDRGIPTITMPVIRIKFLGIEAGSAINDAIAQMDRIKQVLLDSVLQGFMDASSLIGEAIGGIFSGENVGSSLAKAAQGMLAIVGGVLQAVGREIIVTSALVKALKEALNKLFGPGGEAVAAGVGFALVALGGALRNIKFDVPKLAQGGIATGPTLGIFGEAGTEAIIPLDKLPSLLGNINAAQPQVVVGTTTIKGNDLQIIFQRTKQSSARLG